MAQVESVVEGLYEFTCDLCSTAREAVAKCQVCRRDICSKHFVEYWSDPFTDEYLDTYEQYESCSDCSKIIDKYRERLAPIHREHESQVETATKECENECKAALGIK